MKRLSDSLPAINRLVTRQQTDNPAPECGKCGQWVDVAEVMGLKVAPKLCATCCDAAEAIEHRKKEYQRWHGMAGGLSVPVDWTVVEREKLKPTPDLIEHRETIRDYLDHWEDHAVKGTGLTIQSETTGNGKTTLARCVATILRRQMYRVLMVRSEHYREAMSDRVGREMIRSAIAMSEALVLDDIGTERPTQEGLTALSELVDEFNSQRKPLIVTKNESWGTIAEAYSGRYPKRRDSDDNQSKSREERMFIRIADRLNERNISMTFLGASLRKERGGLA